MSKHAVTIFIPMDKYNIINNTKVLTVTRLFKIHKIEFSIVRPAVAGPCHQFSGMGSGPLGIGVIMHEPKAYCNHYDPEV